ncbi:GTP-binding protein [Candidatus Woesearchaeota archaeon]|nr:GTP-binding protein [Candidatus Woesearchaeota archaeon]
MVDYLTQIKELEAEISKTKYNKATQHHIGLLKAKIAMLKGKQLARSASKGKSTGYEVRKTGNATVILVGFPSVGKSTLLNSLTNAHSEVAAYAFTTLKVIPGLLEHRHAKIQILDVPGVVQGAAAGTGRGKEVLAVMRSADMALLLIDVHHPEHHAVLLKEIYDTGLRLNERKPDVRIKKMPRGGLRIGKTVKLSLDDKTIASILHEFKITNADVLIRSPITAEQLIDCIEENTAYIPALTVINKIDTASPEQVRSAVRQVHADLAISAEQQEHIGELKELIFAKLRFIRINLKEPGKQADTEEPLIMFSGCTIRDVCRKLHKDFETKFRFARVWGRSVKFAGMRVTKIEHALQDDDILELHIG